MFCSRSCLAVLTLTLTGTIATADSRQPQSSNLLEGIEKTIHKEPNYISTPRYLLLALGADAETRIWLVEDGKTLYVDKNGNGDLTDDGPPLVPTDERHFNSFRTDDSQTSVASWDFDYVLDEMTPLEGSQHTDFRLARWNYGDPADSYGLSLTLNDQIPMYAGWMPFWSDSPAAARIIHFGGRLQPKMLRFTDFVLESGTRRLSIALINPGLGDGSSSRLSIDAIPITVVPEVHIDWPVAQGGEPLRTTHRLTERCCYWEYYTSNFQVPSGAAPGTANVMVTFPKYLPPIALKTDKIEVVVRAAE